MQITQQDFKNLKDLIYETCGIVVAEEKMYLIRQRLEPLATSLKCNSFEELYDKLVHTNDQSITELLIDCITTNETSFFRDKHPFESFQNYILPKLADTIQMRKSSSTDIKARKIRIWSSASSTGQEPYSIAINIHEYIKKHGSVSMSPSDFSILATDISDEVLMKAKTGEYTANEINRGFPADKISEYFQKNDSHYKINDSIRNMVEYRKMNLVKPFSSSYFLIGGFDVIFCRNVLIYFDDDARRNIVDQFYTLLSDGGFLILGASESLYGISNKFKSESYGNSIVYIK